MNCIYQCSVFYCIHSVLFYIISPWIMFRVNVSTAGSLQALHEEIISRKKTVDQAIKNGQALLKQTTGTFPSSLCVHWCINKFLLWLWSCCISVTGEEVLLIQEKLDGIKNRYAEMTAGSNKALRTLEQALQLATRFASSHNDINQWLDSVEVELNNIEPDTTPAYQDRQRVRMSTILYLLSTN